MSLSLKAKGYREDSKWYSIYWKWDNLAFQIGPAFYFDNRVCIVSSIVPLVTIICIPLIIHFNMWFALLWLFIPYGKIYIHLPIYSDIDDCEYPQYGFYLYGSGSLQPVKFDEIVITMGYKNFRIKMPWYFEWYRTSVLKRNGTWLNDYGRKDKRTEGTDFFDEKWKDIIRYRTYTYIHTLKSGEKQYRAATVKTEQREWRPFWFQWTSLFKMVRTSIDIKFTGKETGEVGERTGSWKGGTTGCGWDILEGETPEQTLRRMEKQRKF